MTCSKASLVALNLNHRATRKVTAIRSNSGATVIKAKAKDKDKAGPAATTTTGATEVTAMAISVAVDGLIQDQTKATTETEASEVVDSSTLVGTEKTILAPLME